MPTAQVNTPFEKEEVVQSSRTMRDDRRRDLWRASIAATPARNACLPAYAAWADWLNVKQDVRLGTAHGWLQAEFERLAREWREESELMSSVTRMVRLPAYQGIIALGMAAVPLLLRELETRPDHWFVALSAITHENPIAPEHTGDVKAMAGDWIEWGKKRGYLA